MKVFMSFFTKLFLKLLERLDEAWYEIDIDLCQELNGHEPQQTINVYDQQSCLIQQ